MAGVRDMGNHSDAFIALIAMQQHVKYRHSRRRLEKKNVTSREYGRSVK